MKSSKKKRSVAALRAMALAAVLFAWGGELRAMGLTGQYFDNPDFTGYRFTREEDYPDYDWSIFGPSQSGEPVIDGQTFSVRWTGRVLPPTTGNYTFYVTANDGWRLQVGGGYISRWNVDGTTTAQVTIPMTAGTMESIRLDYRQATGGALVKLEWSGPGIAKQVIAPEFLFKDAQGATGVYFDDTAMTFGAIKTVRVDSNINFNWGSGIPTGTGITSPDTFSVWWSAYYVPPHGDGVRNYTFSTVSDDGVRVWLDERLIINNWTVHSATTDTSASIPLEGGKRYLLTVKYFEESAGSQISLSYNNGLGSGIISSSDLFARPPGAGDQISPLNETGLPNNRIWAWNGKYMGLSGFSILSADTLENLSVSSLRTQTTIFTPPSGALYGMNPWIHDIHLLDHDGDPNTARRWYLYYSAGDDEDYSRRLHVLERNAASPLGPFTYKAQIGPSNLVGNIWSCDQNQFQFGGENYLVWSAWIDSSHAWKQHLFISKMSNPWTVSTARAEISGPTYDWERWEEGGVLGWGVNEWPFPVSRGGRLNLLYSGSRTSTPQYCVGLLTLTGTNPLVKSHWTKKSTPVLVKSTGSPYGPGEPCVFGSPDGTDPNWIAFKMNRPGEWVRERHVQPFTWNSDNTPNFGSTTPLPNLPLIRPPGAEGRTP